MGYLSAGGGRWRIRMGRVRGRSRDKGVGVPFGVPIVLGLARWIAESGIAAETLWPHHLPVWMQAALMMLLADLGRYWLHRAFHTFAPMWRLHAVHHSPHRLYWLNVGRFHPIEKIIQYAFNALPFALLGVSTEVLAVYLVFYALNGFYQHSNCLVRLGPLSYLVAEP